MAVKGLRTGGAMETLPAHHSAEVVIPERHQDSLNRTIRVSAMVGRELPVNQAETIDDLPRQPGAYVFTRPEGGESVEEIVDASFELEAKVLSGKIDSAHAVLPGKLRLDYGDSESTIDVAVKNYEKRSFDENFERVKKEVAISALQEEAGELAFSTVAVVIAPPAYRGSGTDMEDYDVFLVTRLNEDMKTLDNAPWQRGFTEANLHLAEAAVNAIGRFNANIGIHNDAKIKNVAQTPTGQASMIDFETSEVRDMTDPMNARTATLVDLETLFDTLQQRGFFNQEPHRAHEVVEALAQNYLDNWVEASQEVQNAVYEEVLLVNDRVVQAVNTAYAQSLSR